MKYGGREDPHRNYYGNIAKAKDSSRKEKVDKLQMLLQAMQENVESNNDIMQQSVAEFNLVYRALQMLDGGSQNHTRAGPHFSPAMM